MKRDLMDILCCPVHKTDLALTAKEENAEEILEGDLYCARCDFHYPIAGGIPNLLPPEMHETKA
ncbi:MAG TPA: methytransferase partner Trm112 [Candidatus Thermoplasmatota archaeon]|nr:methytransferase partner Trm112 [Candidatus Thermoplasmatota archaeon]